MVVAVVLGVNVGEPVPPVATVYHNKVFVPVAVAVSGTALVAFSQYTGWVADTTGALGVAVIVVIKAVRGVDSQPFNIWLT